jgi:hypothetical protein
LLVSLSVAAGAQQTAKPAPQSPKSAVVHVSQEIAQGIGQVAAGAIVVASPIASDVPAQKSDELAVRVAAQIAGRLGVARAHPQAVSLSVARGISGRAASLVYVQLEIVKGELRATADLYPVVSNGWERLRNPAPGPRAHAFASASIDAEVRSFMSPVVLEQASVHKAKHEETDVLAIGCGDVDGDGGLELAIVSRTRVTLGKLRGGKLAVVRAVPWHALASRAPVPMREPLASVVVAPRMHRNEILVGSTDRSSVAADASLTTLRVLSGLPVPGGDGMACTQALAAEGAFDGNVVTCATPLKGEPGALYAPPVPRYDAIASLDLVGKDGSTSHLVAVREPNGKLRVRRGGEKGQEIVVERAGAQIALADLDLDGVPEIVSTADSGEDFLFVQSWDKDKPRPRLKLAAKEGVRAVAACPPEERGVPSLVAVVGSEVWVVR